MRRNATQYLFAGLLAFLLLPDLLLYAQDATKTVERAPRSSDKVWQYALDPHDEPQLSDHEKLRLLRKKIKYVFVLFQENRSFDFYFGTYPGARGLFSQPASETPGFVQPLVDTDGSVVSISPFLIPQTVTNTTGATVLLYPEDTDSVNHSHSGIDNKMHFNSSWVAQNDRYAFVQEGLTGTLSADGTTYTGPAPTLAQKQMGELVVSHVDCTTAPFLWNYADRFTLFDDFSQTVIGPSTPNAIAMISGQSGLTEWVEHPNLAMSNAPSVSSPYPVCLASSATCNVPNQQLPVTSDPQPFWGSTLDTLTYTPAANPLQPTEEGAVQKNPGSNLTYAALPLSFMGNQIQSITAQDLDPLFDLQDIQNDITKIAGDGNKPVNWGWFQEGYDLEPTDPDNTATHANYIAHHNGPQYFGYEANNPHEIQNHLRGLADFYAAIKAEALPEEGGVFYVRGGYGNNDGLAPRSPSPSVQANFPGNDDHPGYSDAQISEALLADSINAIAGSKYWPHSAIIITYDETDGLYDHWQPAVRNFDPLGNALEKGPRIPGIVISPYGRAHAISHEPSEHGSIIKFIDKLFNLTPLADLPDEASARELGQTLFGQSTLGPSDGSDTPIGALFSAFDNRRLLDRAQPLPRHYAMIPQKDVTTLPHFNSQGCKVLHIRPTDLVHGQVIDPAPADFNPRPSSNPGLPTTPGWPTN